MDNWGGNVQNSGDTNGSRITAAVNNGGSGIMSSFKTDNGSRYTAAVSHATGVCALASCQQSFVKTVPNKKYCCEKHKIAAWELRTGKRLNLNKR